MTTSAFSERVIADVQWQLMGGMVLPEMSDSKVATHWEQAQRYRLQRNRMLVPAGIAVVLGIGFLLAGSGSARLFTAILAVVAIAGVLSLDGLVRRSEEAAFVHSSAARELPSDLADIRWASIAPRRWIRWRRRRLMGKGRQTMQVQYRPVPLASHMIVRGGPLATIHRLRRRREAAADKRTAAAQRPAA